MVSYKMHEVNTAYAIALLPTPPVGVNCPQGIAFFMNIRSDHEKSTKKP